MRKKIQRIKKIQETVHSFDSNKNVVLNKVKVNSINICNEVKKIVKEQSVELKSKPCFADTLKMNIPARELKKQLPVLVKPKEKQKVHKTKEDLNIRVNPADMNFISVEGKSKGAIIFQACNKANQE